MLKRRGLLISLFVAPAIIRPGLLMPISPHRQREFWLPCDGRAIDPKTYPELSKLLGGIYGRDGFGRALVPDLGHLHSRYMVSSGGPNLPTGLIMPIFERGQRHDYTV